MKKFLKYERTFYIFIKMYDQIEQTFNQICGEIQTQMEIIVDIRRLEVTKSWYESLYYVTRPSNDVNVCTLGD